MHRLCLLALSCSAALLAACPPSSTTGDGGPDAGVEDAGPVCSPNLPPASDPCLEGQCGNEKGVGQPCSQGGGECSDLGSGNAILCTVDFADTDLHFCTRPCVVDEDCGAGAVCARDPDDAAGGAGCLPASCYTPPPDAGAPADAGDVDGGAVDGGAVDAGDVDAGAVDAGGVDAG